MPWSDNDYPVSLKNFTADVRRKAIEIANALLKDGYDEGRAIAIATAQAEEWATNRGKQVKKKSAGAASKSTPASAARSTAKKKAPARSSSKSKRTATSK